MSSLEEILIDSEQVEQLKTQEGYDKLHELANGSALIDIIIQLRKYGKRAAELIVKYHPYDIAKCEDLSSVITYLNKRKLLNSLADVFLSPEYEIIAEKIISIFPAIITFIPKDSELLGLNYPILFLIALINNKKLMTKIVKTIKFEDILKIKLSTNENILHFIVKNKLNEILDIFNKEKHEEVINAALDKNCSKITPYSLSIELKNSYAEKIFTD